MRAARRIKDGVGCIYNHEQGKLDAETQQIADDIGQRHHQSRKINFAEDAGIIDKGIGGLGQAVGEILPQAGAGQVEQRLRHAVGGHAGDAAKHHHIHYHGKRWLHHKPQRSKDGLLVLGNDVAFDQQRAKVAVAPEFLEIDRQQPLPRLDDQIPFFLLCHIY